MSTFLKSRFESIAEFNEPDIRTNYNLVKEQFGDEILEMSVYSFGNDSSWQVVVCRGNKQSESPSILFDSSGHADGINLDNVSQSQSMSGSVDIHDVSLYGDFKHPVNVVFSSPPYKKQRLNDDAVSSSGIGQSSLNENIINLNDGNSEHNLNDENNTSNKPHVELKDDQSEENDVEVLNGVYQIVYIVELKDIATETFDKIVSSVFVAGNCVVVPLFQLKDGITGDIKGNIIGVQYTNPGSLIPVLQSIEIPILSHMMNKPEKMLETLSYVISTKLGTNINIRSKSNTGNKHWIIECFGRAITTTTIHCLVSVYGCGRYEVLQANGDSNRVIVFDNREEVLNLTKREMMHPWKCGVYLGFKNNSKNPTFSKNPAFSILPAKIIDSLHTIYEAKEIVTFCSIADMFATSLRRPEVFLENGGINPGISLWGKPDRGKSHVLSYIMALFGCAGKNSAYIHGNYTSAYIQKIVDQMPGSPIIFEDADRLIGNKKNVDLITLIWIMSEVNSNSTVTGGEKKGSSTGYITTGNLSVGYLKDEGTQARVYVMNWNPERLMNLNIAELGKLIEIAPFIKDELAKRTVYTLQKSAPSKNRIKMCQGIIDNLVRVIQSESRDLLVFFPRRTRSLFVYRLAGGLKMNKILFGSRIPTNEYIVAFNNQVAWYLQLVKNVKLNPLNCMMSYTYDEHIRFFIFAAQCTTLIKKEDIDLRLAESDDNNEILLLKKIKRLLFINFSTKSIVFTDAFIGINSRATKASDPSLSMNDINNLCQTVSEYYSTYKNIDLLQQNNNNDNNDHDIKKNVFILEHAALRNALVDIHLDHTALRNGTFMDEVKFNEFFVLSNKNNKVVKENNYLTTRCLGNRYYAFRVPDIFSKYGMLLKHKKKRNARKKNGRFEKAATRKNKAAVVNAKDNINNINDPCDNNINDNDIDNDPSDNNINDNDIDNEQQSSVNMNNNNNWSLKF